MSLFRRTEEEKQLRAFYRPWYRRPIVWLVLMLPVLGVARLALTPLAWYEVRTELRQLPEYDVSFSSLSLAIFGKNAVFRDVKVFHRAETRRDDAHALLTAPFVQVDVPLLRLWRGGDVEAVTLIDPVFRLRTDAHLAASAEGKAAWVKAARQLPLRAIKVVRIERGTVLAAEQAQSGLHGADRPLMRDLHLSVTGLGFGGHKTGTDIVAEIKGGLMLGSGILTGQARFVPDGERSWDFSGEAFVAGLDLQDLYGHALAPARPDTMAPRGKFKLRAKFATQHGQLTAELEPQMQIDPGSAFNEDVRVALEAKITRTTGMTVWIEGKRLQAALPATMAPVRFAAVVSALALQSVTNELRPPAPIDVPTAITADVQIQ